MMIVVLSVCFFPFFRLSFPSLVRPFSIAIAMILMIIHGSFRFH